MTPSVPAAGRDARAGQPAVFPQLGGVPPVGRASVPAAGRDTRATDSLRCFPS